MSSSPDILGSIGVSLTAGANCSVGFDQFSVSSCPAYSAFHWNLLPGGPKHGLTRNRLVLLLGSKNIIRVTTKTIASRNSIVALPMPSGLQQHLNVVPGLSTGALSNDTNTSKPCSDAAGHHSQAICCHIRFGMRLTCTQWMHCLRQREKQLTPPRVGTSRSRRRTSTCEHRRPK